MTEKNEDAPKISLSNTKKEMLEAFNQLKDKLQEQASAGLEPEKAREEKKEKEIVKTADIVTSDSVISRVNDLKMEVTKSLSGIAAKIEEETARYNKIKEAIEVKNKEIQDIFEIDSAAFSLAALLEAQKQKKFEFEKEMEQNREILEKEINSRRAEWEKEKQLYLAMRKEQNKEDEKIRERRKEEYEYNFNREQEQKKRKLNDEIAQLEKDLQNKKEEFEKQTAEKENELLQRDIAISEREKRMNDLQGKVDTFPKELEDNINKTVKGTTDSLKAEAKKNEELIVKVFEGEKNVLSTKIDSLEKMVAVQNKQIEALSAQLENAYGKVQDIAVKAVASSQNVNVTAPNQKPLSIGQERS